MKRACISRNICFTSFKMRIDVFKLFFNMLNKNLHFSNDISLSNFISIISAFIYLAFFKANY